jgi:hypothetical protein
MLLCYNTDVNSNTTKIWQTPVKKRAYNIQNGCHSHIFNGNRQLGIGRGSVGTGLHHCGRKSTIVSQGLSLYTYHSPVLHWYSEHGSHESGRGDVTDLTHLYRCSVKSWRTDLWDLWGRCVTHSEASILSVSSVTTWAGGGIITLCPHCMNTYHPFPFEQT